MAEVAKAKVTLSLEDKVTGAVKRIKAQFSSISKSLKLDAFSASAKQLVSSLNGVQGSIKAATGRAAKFAAVIGLGGGSLTGIAMSLTKNLAATGAEIGKTSKQLGISVESLQLWRREAEKAGSSASAMDSAIANLDAASRKAAGGDREMAAVFKKLGISQRDAQGRLKSMSQLLLEVGDSLSKVKSKAERENIAETLFGSKDMSAVMGKSFAELQKGFEKTRKESGVLGKDVTDESTKFAGLLDSLKQHFIGLKNILAAQLLPAANDVLKSFRDWLADNKQEIIQKITDACKSLYNVIADLKNPTSELRVKIDELWKKFKGVKDAVQPVIDFVGGPLNAALIALGAYIVGPFVSAFATAGKAVILFGNTLLTTPIGWIIAGIAAIAGVVYLIYKNWDDFCAYWSGLWDNVTSAFDKGFIQGVLSLLYNFNPSKIIIDGINWLIKYLFGIDLKEVGIHFVSSLWDGLKSKWQAVKKWLKESVASLTGWMPDWMRNKLGLNFKIKEEAVKPAKAVQEAAEKTEKISKSVTENTKNITENIHKTEKLEQSDAVRDGGDAKAPIPSEAEQQQQLEAFKASGYNQPLTTPNKETKIDASVQINSLTVETPNGLPDEIRRIVLQELEKFAAAQSHAITSSLSD